MIKIRDLIDFEGFLNLLIGFLKGVHIKWPLEPLPEPGTAAEWTAGFCWGHSLKTTP